MGPLGPAESPLDGSAGKHAGRGGEVPGDRAGVDGRATRFGGEKVAALGRQDLVADGAAVHADPAASAELHEPSDARLYAAGSSRAPAGARSTAG